MIKTFIISALFVLFPSLVGAQELNVKTIERKPFVFIEDKKFSGFSIDLWEAIAKDNNWEFTYEESSSFVDLLRSAREGTTDLAVANISATKDRAELMDFSAPIFDSGLQIMIPKVETFAYLSESFSLSQVVLLVTTIIILLIILSHALWILERNCSTVRIKYSEGILDALCRLITLGKLGKKLPYTGIGKVILLMWLIAVSLSAFLYISSIATTFTSMIADNKIATYEDLRGKKVGTTRGSTSQAFLRKNKIPSIVYSNPDHLFLATALGEIDAAVHDVALLQYFSSNQGSGKVTILPEVYDREYYALALPLGSQLKDPINESLAKMRSNGTYSALFKKWFTQNK